VGSVNRWECDENDHLNVRFYANKIHQALANFLEDQDIGLQDVRVVGQHIRFVQEARVAAPLRVDCTVRDALAGGWEVACLMHQNLTDAPVAGFLVRVEGEALPALAAPGNLPEWALPRGLDPSDPFPIPESLQAAESRGFQMMGRGRIGAAECDRAGVVLPEVYIGRISDGMPNLWAFTTDAVEAERRLSGGLGGAALEYRLDILKPLERDDRFRHLSGIRNIGNKTQHMVHLLIAENRDEVAVRAEAIGVGMDLATRKAVPISDARRLQLEKLLVS
jgi:acyl-CoA thioester hydrolase